MSKNMTTKGLALGSVAALVVAGFSAAPANALGLADTTFVSLTPTTGTEYAVLASDTGSGATFSLASNEAVTVSTGDLKFLVTDPNSWVEPTIATEGREITVADNATIAVTAATDLVRVTSTHDLQIGDKFYWTTAFDGAEDNDGAGTEVIAAANTIFTVSDISGTSWFEFTSTTNIADAAAIKTDGATTMKVIREARSTTGAYAGTYVIDSGSTDAANVENITLASDSLETRSVTVQAWMDANDDDAIDSTEYASPVRTITWVKPSELVTSVSMAPVAGDTELNAVVTTTPVLNGEQTNGFNATWLNVEFGRQDSAQLEFSQDEETGTSTSIWSDVSKTWTVDVDLDAESSNTSSTAAGTGDTVDGWSDLSDPLAIGEISDVTISVLNDVATATVFSGGTADADKVSHLLRVGDKITFEDQAGTNANIDGEEFTVTSVPTASTFTFALDVADGALTSTSTDTEYDVTTYAGNTALVDRVFAGTYTAQVYVAGVKSGAKLSVGTIAAATASASMTSVGSASVTGNTVTTDVANNQTIKVGTASADFVVTAFDADGDALGAGRTVVVTTEAPVDGGATIGSFKVNGGASATLTTDANGQVKFTVSTSDTSANAQTRVSALVENKVTVGMDLHWDAQAYNLVDFGTTAGTIATDAAIARTTTASGSYTLALAVTDQWFQPAPSANYDIVVSGSGVTEGVVALVNGRANVKVTDAGITAVGSSFTSTVVLRKDKVAVSTHTVTTTIAATSSVKLGADASSTYQPAGSTALVDLSDKVAAKALVEIDKRSQTTATPAYANDLILQGMVANTVSAAAITNAYVTISGPSNILFSNGQVAARGSLTFLSDSNGEFEVYLYSTTSQTDTVITVTSLGGSSTTKVSFTGIGVGEGTALVVTTPEAVKPASTFQVKAQLNDAYGNGVAASTAGLMKVTYTGPGIVFGSLPDKTDATGGLSFSVLLGSNDTSDITVLVSYDQNGDGDFKDAKDLNVTKTIKISASGTVSAGKVNVGSFNGKLVVYASGLNGAKISWKVGGKWGVGTATSNYAIFDRPTPVAGATVSVDIYVNGVKTLTKSVVTR
jgi:hypothetical protein